MPDRNFSDRYQLEEQLEAAEEIKLFKARDDFFPRTVFITVYSNCDAEMKDSFRARVQSLAGLSHHHIMSIFDMECVDDNCYLISEYPGGITLREAIDLENRFSLEEALYMAGNMAEALAHAHKQGVYHGRLTPDMIWLQGGDIRLAFVCPRSLMDWIPDSKQNELQDLLALGSILKELLASTPPLYKTEVRSKVKEIIDRLAGKRQPGYQSASDVAYDLKLILTKDLNPLFYDASRVELPGELPSFSLQNAALLSAGSDLLGLKLEGKTKYNFGAYFSACFLLLWLGAVATLMMFNPGEDSSKRVADTIPHRIANAVESSTVGIAWAETSEIESNVTISPKEPVRKISTASSQTSIKTVPPLIGLTQEQAEQLLLERNMGYKFYIENSDAPAGIVYMQEQSPGQPYKPGEKVIFYVSRGK